MTDNEIIKALECLISKAGHENHRCCKGCVYEKQCKTECGANIVEYALDLIKRQKAEIESLKEALKDLKRNMSYMSNPNTIGDRHEMGCW